MRIDFYITDDESSNATWHIACRLLEKAHLLSHQVFVYCNHQQDAELLDELLWTFKEQSFIPHHIQGEGPEPPARIQIGFSEEAYGFHDVLLNMSDVVPSFYTQFRRVIEIVGGDESAKIIKRNHYQTYRKMGLKIETHNLKSFEIETTNNDPLP